MLCHFSGIPMKSVWSPSNITLSHLCLSPSPLSVVVGPTDEGSAIHAPLSFSPVRSLLSPSVSRRHCCIFTPAKIEFYHVLYVFFFLSRGTYCTGWPFSFFKTSRWHQNKSSVLVWGPCTKTQPLFWCQREVLTNVMCHPVVHNSQKLRTEATKDHSQCEKHARIMDILANLIFTCTHVIQWHP